MKHETEKNWFSVSALSVVMHVVLLGACAWYFNRPITVNIIAAGQGEGNGDAMMEVGTVDGKTLGFTPFKPVSTAGDEANTANNVDVSTDTPKPDPNAEILPSESPTPKPKDSLTTDRPTVQSPQFVSKDPLRGGTTNTSVEVGRTGGSPVPSLTQGVGVGSGATLAGNTTGVPGGSAYGKIIQGILGRNYNPPTTYDVSGSQFVIVQLHIARDGRILSVVNGRVAPNHFKQRSANGLINNAVERAVIAANAQGLPPFPNGFLMGAQEAVAEVWFKYPK
ncbi:MAG TPA: TonB C-terminal domain-containing protein [Blastocatellia bacterium]|nr:TonB C-terminal domain-containing protein [Blastocatellia bacterium]